MVSKIFPVIVATLVLSGCSIGIPSHLATSGGSVWKSFDAGETFVPKVTVSETQRISTADVVSLVFDPRDAQVIYIGTRENGIFKTSDGAEHWEQLVFPPIKTYGLALDQQNGDRLYASGVYAGIAKIYRSDDAGKNWTEIYTEPGEGTVITALVSHPDVPLVLYAGTSAGVVIKSTNGGETWKNVLAADGPVTKALFHKGSPDLVTLLVLDQGVAVSADGGTTWNKYAAGDFLTANEGRVSLQNITTITADPNAVNTLYAGAQNGLFRSTDGGQSWQAIDIIESSRAFPVRAVAVNPLNPSEIVYAAGNAFYKSVDGGMKWATTQLEIDRGVNIIEYDPSHPEIMYFALRKF
ncbi:MAG: YCF48-related protein [Candidatus Moraniibacteriota bacterium]